MGAKRGGREGENEGGRERGRVEENRRERQREREREGGKKRDRTFRVMFAYKICTQACSCIAEETSHFTSYNNRLASVVAKTMMTSLSISS